MLLLPKPIATFPAILRPTAGVFVRANPTFPEDRYTFLWKKEETAYKTEKQHYHPNRGEIVNRYLLYNFLYSFLPVLSTCVALTNIQEKFVIYVYC